MESRASVPISVPVAEASLEINEHIVNRVFVADRVGAGVTIVGVVVGATAAEYEIVAAAGVHGVHTDATFKGIVALAAIEAVITLAAVEAVVSSIAVEAVVADAAFKGVHPLVSEDAIVAGASHQKIVAGQSESARQNQLKHSVFEILIAEVDEILPALRLFAAHAQVTHGLHVIKAVGVLGRLGEEGIAAGAREYITAVGVANLPYPAVIDNLEVEGARIGPVQESSVDAIAVGNEKEPKTAELIGGQWQGSCYVWQERVGSEINIGDQNLGLQGIDVIPAIGVPVTGRFGDEGDLEVDFADTGGAIAVNHVVAAATVDGVVAATADQRVVPERSIDGVATIVAAKNIVLGVAG